MLMIAFECQVTILLYVGLHKAVGVQDRCAIGRLPPGKTPIGKKVGSPQGGRPIGGLGGRSQKNLRWEGRPMHWSSQYLEKYSVVGCAWKYEQSFKKVFSWWWWWRYNAYTIYTWRWWWWKQRRPSPLRPWCISALCFRFSPYFQQIFSLCGKFFLVIDHKFRISPYFPCFSIFPPCFAKIIVSPTLLWKILPCFRKIHLLFKYFMCISFPPYTLTMMHLRITQCTYWTPLDGNDDDYDGDGDEAYAIGYSSWVMCNGECQIVHEILGRGFWYA